MGILYLNLINTLLASQKYDKSLIFSIVSTNSTHKHKTQKEKNKTPIYYDDLYYISLSDLFKFLNVKSNIIFKQPRDEFIKTFDVIIDGEYKTIKTDSIVHLAKHIIKFADNKDLPINNTIQMHHSPFIIYNNHNIKLPNSLILNFDKECNLITKWETFETTNEKHANYNLITPFISSLTPINLKSFNKLSFKNFKPSQTDISIFKQLIQIQ
jgi:hypothetical protein